MSNLEINQLVTNFYEGISFDNRRVPKLADLKHLFFGDGILINNSFAKPLVFTLESFVQALESQAAEGNIQQFLQREVNATTEVYCKVGQRISVYEYNFADTESERLPRGVNYIQVVQADGEWKILSMAWCDENENRLIPEEYL
jgi:hypothetical protein